MFIFSGKISDEPETTTFFGDKFEFPTLSKTLLTARQQLESEAHKISVKAKTTLKRIKEFTNSSKPDGKCQSAADCKTNQVTKNIKSFYDLIKCLDLLFTNQ